MRLDPYEMLADVMRAREEPWRQFAECHGLPNEWFFPTRGDTPDPRARDACAHCPVSAECKEFSEREEFGLWAGQSGKARRDLRARVA